MSGNSERTFNLALGIVWFLVPDEAHNSDGMHTSYLNKTAFRPCDPKMYDALRNIIAKGYRSVLSIRSSDIFPPHSVYVDAVLDYDGIVGQKARLEHRQSWLENALAQTAECDLVFLDPDNGFEVKSVPLHARKGPKYVGWAEVGRFLERDQSLVVYHHLNRTASASFQIAEKLGEIRERFDFRPHPIPVLFRRGSLRVFFLFPSPRHTDILTTRLKDMLAGPWAAHMEIFAP